MKSRLRDQIMNFPVKMMEIPVNMMKLPVNAMVSSMNTITESMQEIQKKSRTCRESVDSEETDEGRRSAFRKASKSAMMPYLEMFKLPRSVLLSGLKSISETVQELRDRTASENGARSGEGGENGAWEPVELTSEEAALESEAILSEDSAIIPRTILWQIGRPGRSDFQGKWTEVFDYEVGMGNWSSVMIDGAPKKTGSKWTAFCGPRFEVRARASSGRWTSRCRRYPQASMSLRLRPAGTRRTEGIALIISKWLQSRSLRGELIKNNSPRLS
jgi:hypothetical protein